ncbi:MAG: endonuclease III [Phycisphaerales bacterium]|nr:endonuclease III [Phycisphaerales bacterium]
MHDIDLDLPTVSKPARERALRLADALRASYPDAHCELVFANPLQLLVATILSAQATDVSVNKVTPALFQAFPTAEDLARTTPSQIEPFIRSIGLFRNKAKAIHEACKTLVERHQGIVPQNMHELLQLRGVARKTANVVLGNCFNINVGFVVDTHIQRLAVRFGLASPGDSVQTIEKRLMALLPRDRWCELSHQIIWHGRRACKARGIACGEHPVCREFGKSCELRVSAPRSSDSSSPKKSRPKAVTSKTARLRSKPK